MGIRPEKFSYSIVSLQLNKLRSIYVSSGFPSLHQTKLKKKVLIKKSFSQNYLHKRSFNLITLSYSENDSKWKSYFNFSENVNQFYKFLPVLLAIAIFGVNDVACEALSNQLQDKSNTEGPDDSSRKSEIENSAKKPKVRKQNETFSNDSGSVLNKEQPDTSGNNEGKNLPKSETPEKYAEPKTENKNNLEDPNLKGPETNRASPQFPSKQKDNELLPLTLKNAFDMSKDLVLKKKQELGAPGISVAVSINGKNIFSYGCGYADVENDVGMSPYKVMRIASISKSITMVAVAQLTEEGKLDLDAPVQKYVPSFPKKFVEGEEVIITTRHLLSHTSGIRHYKLKCEIDQKDKTEKSEEEKELNTECGNEDREAVLTVEEKRKKLKELLTEKLFRQKKTKDDEDEFFLPEYKIKEEFKTVNESLELFQDDELLFKPGERYHYSTHAWTLVSAVVEGAAGKPFADIMTDLFRRMGLFSTYLDKNDTIIYHRARFYIRDCNGRLKNAPFVDNSYKWAGGGFLSNVVDLVQFGNAMLYSFQNTEDKEPVGFLKASTVKEMWTPVPATSQKWMKEGGYGLGWGVFEMESSPRAFTYNRRFYTTHTGGAVGASSVLLVLPISCSEEHEVEEEKRCFPQGIVVAIITNLQNAYLHDTALRIATLFSRVKVEPKVVGSFKGSEKYKLYNLEES